MSETCTVIIPTFNNLQFIGPCINSILTHTQGREMLRIIVVNNGDPGLADQITKHPILTVIDAGKNLGWEGGLKLGLEHTTSPIVCFMNDDTYIPYSSSLWAARCLSEFQKQEVAAVGPASNVVRGAQNIFLDQFGGYHSPYAPFLIGFCVFMRRSDLDAIGGVDDTLPGGDDFDLSIRFRKLGKKMVICRDVFVYHHGFKTGERVNGGSNVPGGWNSQEMTEKTNIALIRKHGFREWMNCNFGACENPTDRTQPSRENEAIVVAKLVKPGVVYELGCGPSKTVPEAIGFDRVRYGETIPNLEGAKSVADVTTDVAEELPVGDETADTIVTRHILEHCVDTVKTLKLWISKLKQDGRLIICVPDERLAQTIPMNPEHRHGFTPESLQNLMGLLDMKQTEMKDDYNGISFTSVFERGAN